MSKVIIFRPQKCFPPSNAKHAFDGLTLIPGSREYADGDVALLQAHPDYPRYKAWGAIEIVEPKAEINLETQPTNSDLSQYSEDDAEKLIHECVDVATLKGWLKNEKRTVIRQLVNRRIAAIQKGQE